MTQRAARARRQVGERLSGDVSRPGHVIAIDIRATLTGGMLCTVGHRAITEDIQLHRT